MSDRTRWFLRLRHPGALRSEVPPESTPNRGPPASRWGAVADRVGNDLLTNDMKFMKFSPPERFLALRINSRWVTKDLN
jgi:hypothetical protein